MIESYNELLENLKPLFTRIVVTGPQRSSTRFVAKALSSSLSCEYVDEFSYMSWEDFQKKEKAVYQTPLHCHDIHNIPEDKKTCVIFMQRRIEDICASEKRVGWRHFYLEKKAYNKAFPLLNLNLYNCNGEMKQDIWARYQKPIMKVTFFDFNHDAIKDAPGYISRKERKHFHALQVK